MQYTDFAHQHLPRDQSESSLNKNINPGS